MWSLRRNRLSMDFKFWIFFLKPRGQRSGGVSHLIIGRVTACQIGSVKPITRINERFRNFEFTLSYFPPSRLQPSPVSIPIFTVKWRRSPSPSDSVLSAAKNRYPPIDTGGSRIIGASAFIAPSAPPSPASPSHLVSVFPFTTATYTDLSYVLIYLLLGSIVADHVFDHTFTNEMVYSMLIKSIIDAAVHGFNGEINWKWLIFVY